MSSKTTLKKGAEINVFVESLAFGGKGIARYNNIVVFIKNGIPGQELNVVIIKISKNRLKHIKTRRKPHF